MSNIQFEWDARKASANVKKHGISFEEIQALWLGSIKITDAKTQDEVRFMATGKVNEKFYTCIYTMRGEAIRLILARRSRHLEEQRYYESE